jgi:hypothetical protein
MHPLVRSILAVLAGLFVGVVVIGILEYGGHLIYPLPQDLDPRDPKDHDALADYVANAPVGAMLVLLLAYAAGAFCGGWLAATLTTRQQTVHGLIVGGLFLLASAANLSMFPHPMWFVAANLLIVLPVAYVGAKLAL